MSIRADILFLLNREKEMTVDELAQMMPGYDKKKIANNLSVAKNEGLLSSRLDGDRRASYKLTALGRGRVHTEMLSPESRQPGVTMPKATPLIHAAPPESKQPQKSAPCKPAQDEDYGCEMHMDGTLIIWKGDVTLEFQGEHAERMRRFMGANHA